MPGEPLIARQFKRNREVAEPRYPAPNLRRAGGSRLCRPDLQVRRSVEPKRADLRQHEIATDARGILRVRYLSDRRLQLIGR
jgi:hypothetical protein